MSSSNDFSSSICGGHFLLLKPNIFSFDLFLAGSFSSSSTAFRKKNAFHLMRLITLSTFSMSRFLYVLAGGIGMFFME